jgi:hypothetical protein
MGNIQTGYVRIKDPRKSLANMVKRYTQIEEMDPTKNIVATFHDEYNRFKLELLQIDNTEIGNSNDEDSIDEDLNNDDMINLADLGAFLIVLGREILYDEHSKNNPERQKYYSSRVKKIEQIALDLLSQCNE